MTRLHVIEAMLRCAIAGYNLRYGESEQRVEGWVGLDGQPAPEWGTMGLDTATELCQVRFGYCGTACICPGAGSCVSLAHRAAPGLFMQPDA